MDKNRKKDYFDYAKIENEKQSNKGNKKNYYQKSSNNDYYNKNSNLNYYNQNINNQYDYIEESNYYPYPNKEEINLAYPKKEDSNYYNSGNIKSNQNFFVNPNPQKKRGNSKHNYNYESNQNYYHNYDNLHKNNSQNKYYQKPNFQNNNYINNENFYKPKPQIEPQENRYIQDLNDENYNPKSKNISKMQYITRNNQESQISNKDRNPLEKEEIDKNLAIKLDEVHCYIEKLDRDYNKLKESNEENEKLKEKELQIENLSLFNERILKILSNNINISHENKIKLIVLLKRELNRCKKCLPTYIRKKEILNTINENKFSVIIGETGSGKSTQIVQYIYDNYELKQIEENSNKPLKTIAVTEPRKLATSIFSFIADELFLTPKEEVITKTNIRELSNKDENAKIAFYTDRMMVEEIVKDPSANKFSYIIIDEAHERNLFTDIIIGILKTSAKNRNDLKVIITSATIDENLFQKYYNCPLLKISGRLYPVKEKFLDLLPENEEVRTNEIKKYIDSIINDLNHNPQSFGHILIFTSGLEDINKLTKKLDYLEKKNCLILPLHGKLNPEETKNAFTEHDGKVKIILATRIAETSITINNVKYVIDFGYDKENYYDVNKKINIYKEGPITQSSARQRMGRAGRTTDGFCLRLYNKEYYYNMKNFKIPEILRSNLSVVILKLKQFNIDEIHEFDFIERPDIDIINKSIAELKLLEALDENNGKITELGRDMADLPTDPWLSKIIIESTKRSCQLEVMKIISVLVNSHNLFFSKKGEKKNDTDFIKMEFIDEDGYGDLLTFLKIFDKIYGIFKGIDKKEKNNREVVKYCKEHNFNIKAVFSSFEYYEDLNHSMKNKKFINKVLNEKKKQLEEEYKIINENKEDNSFSLFKDSDDLDDKHLQQQQPQPQKKPAQKPILSVNDMLFNLKKDPKLAKIIDNKKNDFRDKEEEIKHHLAQIQINNEKKVDGKSMKENIIKCFLSSFFQNICLYSDSPEIGYTLIREMQNIKLYSTSALVLTETYPKWIITYEITQTNNNSYTKVANKVDISWIKEIVPENYLQFYNITNFDTNPIYKFITHSKVPTIFLRAFYKPSESPMLTLEPFLDENKIFCKSDFERGTLTFWTLSENFRDTKQKVENKLSDLKEAFAKATKDFPYNEKIRITFGKGLNILEIADKGKSRTYKLVICNKIIRNIQDLKSFTSKFSNSIDQLSHLNSYDLEMKIKNSIEKDFDFNNEFIIKIKFEIDAEEIINKIKHEITIFMGRRKLKGDYKLEPSDEEVEFAIKEKLINISIDFIFYKGFSEMKGTVYAEKEVLDRIKKDVNTVNNSIISLSKPQFVRENRYSCFINGLNILDDEVDLYQAFQEISPEIEYNNIIVYRKQTIIDFENSSGKNLTHEEKIEYYTTYSLIQETTKYPESIDELKIFIKSFDFDLEKIKLDFTQENITNIKLKNSNDEKFKRSISEKLVNFNVKNLSQASEFREKFSKKIGMFGDAKTQIIVKFKSIVKITKEKMMIINSSLKEYSKLLELERRTIKIILPRVIEDKGTKLSNLNIIIFSENNMQDVLDVRNNLTDFIKGRAVTEIEYFKVLILFNTTYLIHKESIQKTFNVFIENSPESKEVRICGELDNIKKANEEIIKILNSNTHVYKQINYSGKSIAPFYRNNKELFLKLNNDYTGCRTTFDLRNKCILIFGKKEQIDLLLREIEKHISSEVIKENSCPICFGEPNNPYKLMLCVPNCDSFCKNCLEDLIIQVVNSPENLPLKCPNCNNEISLRDIRNLIKYNDYKKLLKFSFDNFVGKNRNRYRFCPKAGCESVVKILNESKNEPLICEICNFNFCKECNNNFHKNLSCEENKFGVDTKKCPKCKINIHKFSGCHHVTCVNCNAHFCWLCLKDYQTAPEVYNHMTQIHGKWEN